MSYTDEQIIELTAIKVQEVVVPKVEAFTDGVVNEVHKMHLEMKGNREFDATIIAQLNDVRADVAKFEGICKLVTELHTLFCKNGYMQKFNDLNKQWTNYLAKDRVLTCPLTGHVEQNAQTIKESMNLIRSNTLLIQEEREKRQREAQERAEGLLKTRIDDEKQGQREAALKRRWMWGTVISVGMLLTAMIGGILAHALGWW